MNVRVRIQFNPPTETDWEDMQALGRRLTREPGSVRVFADVQPDWLVVEFTMPDEAQYKAVPKIDEAIRFWLSSRWDTTIEFPRTEEEQAYVDRKTARRKARRRAAE
jgi:hypothetical protein